MSLLPIGSLALTEEVYRNNELINQRVSTPEAQQEIQDLQRQQRRRELALISRGTGSVCPVAKLSTLQNRLQGLRAQEYKALLQNQFYNPEVMMAGMCVAESIFYGEADRPSAIATNQRIRNWLRRLRQIGAESVEGYAMVAGLENANDVFIVKAPRSNQEDELQHELFVGMFGLNQLRDRVPNFAYIFGGFRCSPPFIDQDHSVEDPEVENSGIPAKEVVAFCNNQRANVNYVLYENITPAVTLREYVKTCRPDQFLGLYLQALYALNEAYQVCEFTHYDLHDENFLVRDVSSAIRSMTGDRSTQGNEVPAFYIPYTTERSLATGRPEYLLTDRVGTIIDFGIAHIRYENDHYGVYNRLPWGVFSRRGFPMHDAYKLLLMSMRSMLQARNITCFNEAAKILRFFNNQEPPVDIVTSQARTYYYLPFTPESRSLSFFDLTRYIRVVCADTVRRILFDIPNGDAPVLGCSGQEFHCLSSTNALRKAGIDPANPNLPVPDTLFEFYDIASRLLGSGEEDENTVMAYQALAGRFRYIEARDKTLRQYDELSIELVRLLGTLKIMTVRGVPLRILMLYPTMAQYRRFITHVAAIYDKIQQLDLLSTVITNVATTFADTATITWLNSQQSALTEYRSILQEAIDVIRSDRDYLRTLVTGSPTDIDYINRAVAQDYRLNWYWKGISSFDYVIA